MSSDLDEINASRFGISDLTRIGDTGKFLTSCPWWLVHFSPAVTQAAQAYQWAERGELSRWYGRPPPCVLWDAVDAWGRGLKRGEYEHQEKRIEEIKRS